MGTVSGVKEAIVAHAKKPFSQPEGQSRQLSMDGSCTNITGGFMIISQHPRRQLTSYPLSAGKPSALSKKERNGRPGSAGTAGVRYAMLLSSVCTCTVDEIRPQIVILFLWQASIGEKWASSALNLGRIS